MQTKMLGKDYSAPAMEEILYTALLTAITTTIVEGGDIASYACAHDFWAMSSLCGR